MGAFLSKVLTDASAVPETDTTIDRERDVSFDVQRGLVSPMSKTGQSISPLRTRRVQDRHDNRDVAKGEVE